jgi:hypothetical protein
MNTLSPTYFFVLLSQPEAAIERLKPYADFGGRQFALTLDRPTLERLCVEVMPPFADRPPFLEPEHHTACGPDML